MLGQAGFDPPGAVQGFGEPVLAAMRFVGDDHDVAPVGEHLVAVAVGTRAELLDGGEDDPAGGTRQQRPQMGAGLGFLWCCMRGSANPRQPVSSNSGPKMK